MIFEMVSQFHISFTVFTFTVILKTSPMVRLQLYT